MKINHRKLGLFLLPIVVATFNNYSLATTPLTPAQIAQQEAAQKAAAAAAAQKAAAAAAAQKAAAAAAAQKAAAAAAAQKAAAAAAAQKAAATANISSAAASKAAASPTLTNKASASSSPSPQNMKQTTTKIAESKSLGDKQNLTAVNGSQGNLSTGTSGPTDNVNFVSTSPTGQ